MNNNSKAKTLITQLEQEINWVEELNTLLSEEKEILSTSQFNQLETLAEKKQELSTKLEASAKQRVDLIKESNPVDKPHGLLLSDFLKNCATEDGIQINHLNNTLAEKLNLCRELNTINGQVIANNMYTRQQIVNALSGNKSDAVSVYTSNGNLETPSESSHHEEA
ncbi:TPA: flagellar protein FlgN [Legionella pneumophila]|nr:flagellar protein FlgN [Legionella pneumophila]HAT8867935.1 flagellar protein FlgN [Legionella pneumophila subsp. pneumophila]HAT7072108.1 flagellar protein FlgN [Legionella pneumophila]HAT8642069.1 flagellar protein FlgN [Legionella pneumophila]HAT8890078.1 flagellar protein FlgN [Legionella pneumophila subsp. pneumophila]HAT8932383.1 flagellar protein FlgN [Legionella pneumophila subsp. pneumophila]